MRKLALGTVQFGIDYGINNKRGKVPQEEVFQILDRALESGIDTLDTAYAYGESEEVIGKFIEKKPGFFKIISKLPACGVGEVKRKIDESLSRLKVSSLYGYLVHDLSNYKEYPQIWQELQFARKQGLIKKIGMSFYFPFDLDKVLNDGLDIDIVQVPFNVFDQRFLPYFARLKEKHIEIHARSVFLQGLFFKKPDELSVYFINVKAKIESLQKLAVKAGVSLASLCIDFVFLNGFVDKAVIGVDNLKNLNEIIETNDCSEKISAIAGELLDLREDDEGIILPFRWHLNKG